MHSKTTLLNITLIIISFLSILIAFLFVYFSLEKVDVYVADRLIKPKEIIAESDLKKISLPKAFIMDNVIISKEEIIGKNPIMDYTVLRNAFFYKGSLEDKDESKDGVYLKKEEGYVIYDLFIDDIKVNRTNIIVCSGTTPSQIDKTLFASKVKGKAKKNIKKYEYFAPRQIRVCI